MLVKIHKSYREVVAICDSELLGKTFREGACCLNITNFYAGEEKSEDEVEEIMVDRAKEDATFNIVGKRAVEIALKVGLVKEEGVKTVDGIPFALVLL